LHQGSVGRNVYEETHWYAYHAPAQRSSLGQLFLVSKRHFLDFAEMAPAEAASYGAVLRRLIPAVKETVGAERVYLLVTIEGIPHFHTWLVPRLPGAPGRGLALLRSARSCAPDDVRIVVERLRAALDSPDA
jgi:diadenosine tetraphosphate (Ap4A) HIT family hydrolase